MQDARREIDALRKNIGKRYRTSLWKRIENAQVEKKERGQPWLRLNNRW